MKREFVRFIGRVLVFIFVVMMMPNIELTSFADITYDVWVAGVQVDSSNQSDVLGDSTVSFDPATNTLTLTDATISNAAGAGIYAQGIDLTINGVDTDADGSNTITAKDVITTGIDEEGYEYSEIAVYGHGIYVEDGSLTISGTLGDITSDSNSIYTYYDITIDGTVGNISATGNDELPSYSCGICSDFGDITIVGTVGNITAIGNGVLGAVGVAIDGDVGDIEAENGISAMAGDLTVSGTVGDITAATGIVGIGDVLIDGVVGNIVADYGIVVSGGDLTISGTTISIVSLDSGIEVSPGEEYDEYGNVINMLGGNVTIDNGAEVYIETDGNGISSYADVSVSDSQVTINAKQDGIISFDGIINVDSTSVSASKYGPWMEGTTVNVTSEGVGVFAKNGVTISDKLFISTPEDGEVFFTDVGYYTIINKEGNVAESVEIKPLSYTVYITGLQYDMAVTVPVGESVNDTYCERYRVDDFSKILRTEKDGYTFVGWYTDKACTTGNEYTFDKPVTADVTIYPKWVSEGAESPENLPTVDKTEDKTDRGDSTLSNKTDKESNSGNSSEIANTADLNHITSWAVMLLTSGCAAIALPTYDRKGKK